MNTTVTPGIVPPHQADAALGRAWREAQDALPEGWRFGCLGAGANNQWVAYAFGAGKGDVEARSHPCRRPRRAAGEAGGRMSAADKPMWPPSDLFESPVTWTEVAPRMWLSEVRDDSAFGGLHLWWVHDKTPGHACSIGRIVFGGGHHGLVSRDPLTIEGSLLCLTCKTHGFIREGRWVPA